MSLTANKPTDVGDTLMHIAHYKGNKEDIRLLYQYGAKINVQNIQGKTPLHCLLESKEVSTAIKLEMIQEFHQLYNVTIQDQDGKTVGDYAMEYCQESLPLLGISEL
ncbi:ankyrin repeat domain-containing protein [Candidatus Tisiphia endosymbiont of Oplodontha viridula]|uniref:ankyrin repeat domain-containing protein n=1 Tax=Candidatus Tisiphia endosymbiont of Oplodontha viridula TaxID=3077925 RepID=UPI0035C8D235